MERNKHAERRLQRPLPRRDCTREREGMKVTFLVELELDDISNLPGIALELSEDLQAADYQVSSVKPWQRQDMPTFDQLFPPQQ